MLSKKSKSFLSSFWTSGSNNVDNFLQSSKYKHEFIELSKLGKGGYGSVYKVVSPIDEHEYAIKKIHIKNLSINVQHEENYKKIFNVISNNNKFKIGHREVTSMAKLCNHKNLVRFYRSWCEISQESPNSSQKLLKDNEEVDEMTASSDDFSLDASVSRSTYDSTQELSLLEKSYNLVLYIQMQVCEKNTLKEWLSDSSRSIDHVVNMNVFKQILLGVEHIHKNGFIHRDLKPSNMFLKNSNLDYPKIKIGDFGLAVQMKGELGNIFGENGNSNGEALSENFMKDVTQHTSEVGTHLYMAPEVSTGYYNEKVDIYSLGVILYELYHKFDTEMERFVVLNNFKKGIVDFQFKEDFPDVYSLIMKMTSLNPTSRPSVSMLLQCSH